MVLPLIAGAFGRGFLAGATRSAVGGAAKSAAGNIVKGSIKNKADKKINSDKFFKAKKIKKDNNQSQVKKLSGSLKIVKYKPPRLKSFTDSSSKNNNQVVSNNFDSVLKEVKSIEKGINSIKSVLSQQSKSDSKRILESRKIAQIKKARDRESQLESKKVTGGGESSSISAPQFSFMDMVLNYFTNILLGGLLKFLLKNTGNIFKAFDDISKGLDNIFNNIRYSIISLTTTMPKLIKSIVSFGTKIFKGPAKLTVNLLKKLGNSIGTLLSNAGKYLSNFISTQFKNVKNLVSGSGSTRATGVQQRKISPSQKANNVKSKLKKLPTPPKPKPITPTTVSSAQRLFKPSGLKHFKKVSGIFKKIPFIGALIGIGIDLAMGEKLDNAIAGAAGASIGAAIGGAIGTAVLPIPFVGTFLGGTIGAAIGDWGGKEIYKNLKGKITQINPPPEPSTPPTPTPPPGTVPLSPGYAGTGAPGQLFTSNASVTWYNPGLGGINSGTGKADPNAPTSTGEPYQATAFTAAAFPPFLSQLPQNMTTPTIDNPSGRTLARGQAFKVLVTNKKTKKSAIIKVNDVGSGVGPASKQTKWLDFSVAARDYLGTGAGFEIRMAPKDSVPGPIDQNQAKNIQNLGKNSQANTATTYTVAGVTYDMATGRPIDFPGQRASIVKGSKTGLITGYGGGTPFHVDTRWARDLPMEVVVPMIDSMAASLADEGRVMEMGTAGSVTGKRYPLNGSFEDKKRFLQAATSGHHSQRGMAAFDYFIPKASETRFGKSAEYANIPAPALPPGYKMSFHSGSPEDGGAFYQITDPSGKVVFKTFHGDPSKSRLGLLSGQNVLPQQAARTSQELRQRPSYDQQSQTIIVPSPIIQGQTPTYPSGGRNFPYLGGPSQIDILNSYYRAQLMGFLYKQG